MTVADKRRHALDRRVRLPFRAARAIKSARTRLWRRTGLGGSFSDIAELAARCRYGDCRHAGEPGCAVAEAVGSGAVGREHQESSIRLREESEFNELTSAEKGRKDRNFGKYIKTAKDSLRKR